eukprot:Skav209339  [mRNA]  locus=scaffold241:239088:240545:- [translate_table: standard]
MAVPKAKAKAEAAPHPAREYIRFEICDFHCKGLSKTVPARHKDEKRGSDAVEIWDVLHMVGDVWRCWVSVYMYSGALAYGSNQRVMVIPDEIAQSGCPNAKLAPDWSTDQVLPWAGRSDKGITVRAWDVSRASQGMKDALSNEPLGVITPGEFMI